MAISLTPEQERVAVLLAREVGDRVREYRVAHGMDQATFAARYHMHRTRVHQIESAKWSNLNFRTVLPLLNDVGYTLAIVPKERP